MASRLGRRCPYVNAAIASTVIYAKMLSLLNVRIWNCLIDGYARNGTKFFFHTSFPNFFFFFYLQNQVFSGLLVYGNQFFPILLLFSA